MISKNILKLSRQLETLTGRAISDYDMIADGDTVLVCVSGGKDSYTLLHLLMALQQRAPVHFELVAMNLDQQQPGFPADVLPAYFEKIGVRYRIVTANTYAIVKEKIPDGQTTCSLCSRLRRGIIYRTAKEVKANKIALGHHRDDMVHTLFLNLFFAGKIKAMPPKYLTDDGAHIVIRPLAYCAEADIERFARGMDFPIIPCNLCGSQPNLQRQKVKEMMHEWDQRFPGRTQSVLTAMQNVVPSHLADRNLFNFSALQTQELPPNAEQGDALLLHQNDEARPPYAEHVIRLPQKSERVVSGVLPGKSPTVILSRPPSKQPQSCGILFADIVQSSALYLELGDVRAMETVSFCQDTLHAAVHRHHGIYVKMLGDGVMALFSDAEAALQTALEMQRLVNDLVYLKTSEIKIRVGVHFGQVIMAKSEMYGDTLNIAARLMENAEPKGILASWQAISRAAAATQELAKDRGTMLVKGRAEELNVFSVNWQTSDLPAAIAAKHDDFLSNHRLILIWNHLHRSVDERQPVFLIGRSKESHLVLNEPGISLHHARIEYRGQHFYFIDQSEFGTLIIRPGRPSIHLRHEETILHEDGFCYFCHTEEDKPDEQILISSVKSAAEYNARYLRTITFHLMLVE